MEFRTVENLKNLSKWGYGIAWNSEKKLFCPYSTKNGKIKWIKRYSEVSGDNFEVCVEKLYSKIQRIEFHKHLKSASKIVSKWPAWKQNLLGGTAYYGGNK